MQLEIIVIVFLVGCLLLILAITGGGFYIKQLRIPILSLLNRVILGILGILFFLFSLLAILLDSNENNLSTNKRQVCDQLIESYDLASEGQFKEAIQVAKSIPSRCKNYDIVQNKIREWEKLYCQKIQLNFHDQLQEAFDLASQGKFQEAIEVAESIPSQFENCEINNYGIAQNKILQWNQYKFLDNKQSRSREILPSAILPINQRSNFIAKMTKNMNLREQKTRNKIGILNVSNTIEIICQYSDYTVIKAKCFNNQYHIGYVVNYDGQRPYRIIK